MIFFDLETTGFDPIRNDVTSIGCIVTDEKVNVLDKFYIEVRPDINKFTSLDALVVSGFTIDQLKNFPSRKEALITLLNFLSNHESSWPHVSVSHSINNFDFKFLDWCFRKENINYSLYKTIRHDFQLSTIKIARSLGYKNNKLNIWANNLNIDFKHHNALSDAHMCMEIYKWLLNTKISSKEFLCHYHQLPEQESGQTLQGLQDHLTESELLNTDLLDQQMLSEYQAENL